MAMARRTSSRPTRQLRVGLRIAGSNWCRTNSNHAAPARTRRPAFAANHLPGGARIQNPRAPGLRLRPDRLTRLERVILNRWGLPATPRVLPVFLSHQAITVASPANFIG